MNSNRWRVFLAALVLVLATAPALARREPAYDVVDLGTLGGSVSEAFGINASGQVVGNAQDTSGVYRAFVYSGTAMSAPSVPGTQSTARAVDPSGAIAGYYYDGAYEGFSNPGGHVTDVGTLGGDYSVAYALSSAGHVVGSSLTATDDEHAFLWSNGVITDINAFGGEYSSARGVNASGTAVGFSYLPNGAFHAFVRAGAVVTDLGTLGGDYSQANAINDAGQVVGEAYLAGNTKVHGFLWTGSGGLRDLGELGAFYSMAMAVDSTATRIVGRAAVPNHTGYIVYHAFVYTAGRMQDLNKMIPKGTGWVLQEATGVNDAGQIAGTGTIHGQTHAFLLNPR
jgi:probable HAF family extracellular repeat protein